MPIPVQVLACDHEHCTTQSCQRRPSSNDSKNAQTDNLSLECQKSEQNTFSNGSFEQTESERRLSSTSSKFKNSLSSFANESVGPSSWPRRLFSSVGGGKLEVVGAQVLSKKESPALVAIHNGADPASNVDLYSTFDLRKVYNLEGFESPLVRVERKSALEQQGTSYSKQTLKNIDRLIDWNVKKPKLTPVVESNEDIETICLPNSLKLPYGIPTEPVVVTVMMAPGIENDPPAQSAIPNSPFAIGSLNIRTEISDELEFSKPVREPARTLSEAVHAVALNGTASSNKPENNYQEKSQKLRVVSVLDPSGSQSLTDLSSTNAHYNIDQRGETNTMDQTNTDDHNTALDAAAEAVREAELSLPRTTMAGTSSNDPQPVRLDLCNASTESRGPRTPPATHPKKPSSCPKKPNLCKRLLNRIKKPTESSVGESEKVENTESNSGTQDRGLKVLIIKRGFRKVFRKLCCKIPMEKTTAVITREQGTSQSGPEEEKKVELDTNTSPRPSYDSRTQLKDKERQSSESKEITKPPRKGSAADVNLPAELNPMPMLPLKGNISDVEIPPGTNPFPKRQPKKSALKFT